VITFYGRQGEKREVGIVEAVERIQWALREILPQLPESLDDSRGAAAGSLVSESGRQWTGVLQSAAPAQLPTSPSIRTQERT